MTCPNCGAGVAENRRFCGKCGAALTTAAAGDAPPSPPPFPAPQPTSGPPIGGIPAGSGGAPSAWGAPSPSWGAPAAPPPPIPPGAQPASDFNPFAPPDLNPPPGYGPPPQYAPPGYPGAPGGWPGYGYAPPQTNGMAVASLVLGIAGSLLCGIGSVLAIVFGFVSRGQIKRSWGRQTGSGMATAGIVLGFVGASAWVVLFLVDLVRAVNTGT